jgi:hypothetical protein
MDISQSDEKIEKSKALKFLKHGVMPLLPSAKREWTGVNPIKILDGPTPLTWPPEKWETFTPDQKLFAWEMAATIIHSKTNIDYATDKNYLLSCYNFLALPGTSMPVLPKGNTCEINMRLYNYKTLQEIVVQGLQRKSQEKLLMVLDSAFDSRDRTGEDILRMVDGHNLKLRLPK